MESYKELVFEQLEGQTPKEMYEYLVAQLEKIEQIKKWVKAYPVEVFPEPDFNLAARALANAGINLDAITASNYRYILRGIEGLFERDN